MERSGMLDVGGAAQFLGMSKSWIYKAVAAGTVPYVKVGRAVRFDLDRLAEWVKKQAHEVTP